jgi:hypothetical protein
VAAKIQLGSKKEGCQGILHMKKRILKNGFSTNKRF